MSNPLFSLGANAKLYYDPTTSNGTVTGHVSWGGTVTGGVHVGANTNTNLVEIKGVNDVTFEGDSETTDVSARDGQGEKWETKALKVTKLTVKLIDRAGTDSGQQALFGNYLDNSGEFVSVAALSGNASNSGSYGIISDFQVKDWKRAEPINGHQAVDISLIRCPSTTPTEAVRVP